MNQLKIELGRSENSMRHLFRLGGHRSMCGQLSGPNERKNVYVGGAPICDSCIYKYDYRDSYVRKLREYFDAPLWGRDGLPLKRDDK
jgi:hypothetical protein